MGEVLTQNVRDLRFKWQALCILLADNKDVPTKLFPQRFKPIIIIQMFHLLHYPLNPWMDFLAEVCGIWK